MKIAYISDIHLLDKIMASYGEMSTSELINREINNIFSDFASTVEDGTDLIFIAGDISANPDLALSFFVLYNDFAVEMNLPLTIFVLGNHEIMGSGARAWVLAEAFNSYLKGNCFPNKVLVMQNDLICFPEGISGKPEILTEEELLNLPDNKIKSIVGNSDFFVFGGLGFSGKNPSWNAQNGLYGNAYNLDEDIQESKVIDDIHTRLSKIFPTKKGFIVTHTPKTDWSNSDCVPSWLYINGHTHKNKKTVYKNTVFLADNQVGYKKSKYDLKHYNF